MFEAGFAYILSKSLINTRTKTRRVAIAALFVLRYNQDGT